MSTFEDIDLDQLTQLVADREESAARILGLETALNNAADHATEQAARIKALEAEVDRERVTAKARDEHNIHQCNLVRAERDALLAELNASSKEMARACVTIDDLRAALDAALSTAGNRVEVLFDGLLPLMTIPADLPMEC